MAEIKTRYPNQLTDENYDEWFTRWASWFLLFPNTPEYANWLRSGINALDADFHDKLIAVQEAEITQGAATETWNLAAKALRQLLIKLRLSLPTLTPGDDSVLDTLILRGEVPPRDVDKLLIYAELVDNAWQPLSADPQFAPFADRLNLIAPLMTDINDKRIVMGKAILDYSTACDAKTAAREACNTRERAVFNFFRGEGKPDEFWTSSVYGLGTGGEEPSVPIPDWPGPAAFSGKYLGIKQVELIYGPVKDATHCDIDVKPHNESEWTVLFHDLTMDPAKITAMRELNVEEGKRDYRLVPFNGEEKGLNAEITVDVKD